MTPDLKYKRYVIKKFLQEMRGYRIYYNEDSVSYWWINPNKKDWIFEMEKSGTLWWYYSWGERFKTLYSLEDLEFKELMESYVTITLDLGVKKFMDSLHINGDTPLMDDYELDFEEHILECINSNASLLTLSPFMEIKNLYRIDDPAEDEVGKLLITSQIDEKVKEYCDDLDEININQIVLDIVENNL